MNETAQELIDEVKPNSTKWDANDFKEKFYPETPQNTQSKSSVGNNSKQIEKVAVRGFKMLYKPIQKPTAEEIVGGLE